MASCYVLASRPCLRLRPGRAAHTLKGATPRASALEEPSQTQTTLRLQRAEYHVKHHLNPNVRVCIFVTLNNKCCYWRG